MGLLSEALTESAKGGKAAKKNEAQDKDVAETCNLKSFEEHHRNTHHQGGNEGNDSGEEEDEENPHGQRVGCQAQ